jgi:RNA polymerase sigma-70 factor (ECF subfamily)
VNVGAAQGLTVQMTRQLESSASESKWAEAAFEELFLKYYSRIVTVLSRLVGDRAQAEELAIEVFWKAYRQPVLGKHDGNPSGWLYRTATNLGIDALRAAARRKQYEHAAGRAALEAGASAGPLDEVLRAEKSHRVRAVLALLKPAQAQILILRSSGLSYVELAESLGVKRGSVGTMLARAEAEFQKRYLQMHGAEEDL